MTAVTGFTSDLTRGVISKQNKGRLLAGANKNFGAPLITRNARRILINTMSFEQKMLDFQDLFYTRLEKELPPSQDKLLMSKNGIYDTWSKGMAVSGFMASPIGYAPRSNLILRRNNKLSETVSPRFLAIVRALSELCFSQYIESDINVTPGSSTGFVGFRHEADFKIQYVKDLFKPSRIKLFLDLAYQNKDVELANEFETAFAYTAGRRDAIDSPSKERTVYGLKFALDPENNQDDKRTTDKAFVDPATGRASPKHCAMRERLINAGPWGINSFLAVISSGTMKSMFYRYPDVWHVNTAAHIESLVNGHHIFCADASEFDMTHPEAGLDEYHRGMATWWGGQVSHVSEKLLYAPYYARPMSIDPHCLEGKPAWVGEPLSADRQVVCGNRSGHAMTSLINKIMMVAAYLYAIELAGFEVLTKLDYWLSGQGPIKFINNGDDTIIYSKDLALLNTVSGFLCDKETAVYNISREKGAVFNGMPAVFEDEANLIYRFRANAQNSIFRIITPERPIYQPSSQAELAADVAKGRKIFRKYWYLGLEHKINTSYLDPVAEHVMVTFVQLWTSTMRDKMTIPEMLAYARRLVPEIRCDLTEIDRMVLDDPEKLHHRVSRDDVSDAVLKEVSSKVPCEVFFPWVKATFTGRIVTKEEHIANKKSHK